MWNFLRVNVRTCHIFDFFLIFFLMQGIVGIDRNNSGRNRGILLSSQGRISRSKGLRFETLKNLNIDLKSGLGRNRFILIAKVNQKSKKKDFDSGVESEHFFWFLINLGESFNSFWFAIQFNFFYFDWVWFWYVANHDSLANQNQIESRIKGRWIIKSRANQSESQIKLVRALPET